MSGLLYKDFQLILNKVSITSRLLIAFILLLVIIFGRESGTIFLSIMGPIGLASIPTSLLVADHESGWNRFVGVFPISKKIIVLTRYIFCISLIVFVSFITLIFKYLHCSNFSTIQYANTSIHSNRRLIDWFNVCSALYFHQFMLLVRLEVRL